MVKRFPNSFWFLGTSTQGAHALVEVLDKLKAKGLGTNVAMVSVADQFGIELSTAARPALEAAGFKLVYDKSYPITTQDFAPIINEAKAANPDAFIAFSYPPDTFGLTGASIVLGFNPGVFYTAVGTAFPVYHDNFKDNVEGVMGVGGVDPSTPAMQAYFKHHKEVTGAEADRWASPVTYASLQILQQAIEKVGSLDKQAISDAIKTGEFDTVLGKVKMTDNIRENVWWAGQWQGGEFYGLAPTSIPGAKEPLYPKPAWKPAP
jgi:branched-chain amino acid transport system substrate-binding protein